MGTTQPVVKFTYEDYLTTPADERYELLDGDLIMVAAPNLKHQRVSARLHVQMSRFVENRALGTLLYAPCDWSCPTPMSCSQTCCSCLENASTC